MSRQPILDKLPVPDGRLTSDSTYISQPEEVGSFTSHMRHIPARPRNAGVKHGRSTIFFLSIARSSGGCRRYKTVNCGRKTAQGSG